MKAHQRKIRDALSLDRGDLFGAWWDGIEIDIKTAEIKEITTRQASRVIVEYEWLGTMPAIVLHCYGIFFSGVLGGVVVYAPENGENLGVWDKYGFTGKIISLARGACVHWAHPHSGSKLIAASIKQLPKKFEVVTATTDAQAGEIGTLYQACNFVFIGKMSSGGDRGAFTDKQGKTISGRQLQRLYGTRGFQTLQAMGVCAHSVPRKSRYFYFRNKSLRRAISHLEKPYPKRLAQVECDAV